MELCNGCTELIDGDELRLRMDHERLMRIRGGRAGHPTPSHLLETLERGLPPCAGVAVGLDRLFRIVTTY